MKIYTRRGDDGTTSLSGGRRLPKHHLRIEAYGTIDELISWIGLLRDQKENAARRDFLIHVQGKLMAVAAALAYDIDNQTGEKVLPDPECVSIIETEIDKMEVALPPLKSFILPGGKTVVSYCHIARCVCRRAERAVARLANYEYSPGIVQKLLNRLSDYLFVLSRLLSLELDNKEITWPV